MDFTQTGLTKFEEGGQFFWAAGIEDTFITEPWPKTGRTLDEYELTKHYDQWKEDLDLFVEAGVRKVRYGIPWHRIQPSQNEWNWESADKPLLRLIELGIEPVVDLVHYGLPRWIKGAYLNPDYPLLVENYARRVAERFAGNLFAYTPLNEPRVTSWYCGKLGWWPPNRRGWSGFVALTLAISRGIVLTTKALRETGDEVLPVQVDATDLYESENADLQEEVHRRQEIVFLTLDLVSGRVNTKHSLHAWLLKNGAAESDLTWFQENAIDLQIVGINLYPLFSRKVLLRDRHGLRMRMPYADANIIDRLAQMYWERYQCPLFISETASEGSLRRRGQWLVDSVEAVKRVRSAGIPLLGYTWWPLFALVTWGYRQGEKPPEFYLKQMGLWDLDEEFRRIRTPLVDQFRNLSKTAIPITTPVTTTVV